MHPKNENSMCINSISPEKLSYLLHNLPSHLNLAKLWSKLSTILSDLKFLETKAEAGLAFELAHDFAEAVKSLPREGPHYKEFGMLEEAIRREVHFVDQHPSTLFQCLWNFYRWHESPLLSRQYDSAAAGSAGIGSVDNPNKNLGTLLENWRIEVQKRNSPWLRSTRLTKLNLDAGCVRVFQGHEYEVRSACFSSDGLWIGSGGADGTVKIWDVYTGRLLASLRTNAVVTCIAASANSEEVAFGMVNGAVGVWQWRKSTKVLNVGHHIDSVLCVTFSPDGRQICSGSKDETIRIWQRQKGQVICLDVHDDQVSALKYSNDGCLIVAGTWQGKLYYFHMPECAVETFSKGHWGRVTDVACSPSGSFVASSSWDRTIKIWDLHTKTEYACLEGHSDLVWSVAFTKSGERVISSSSDGTVRVWSVDHRKETQQVQLESGHALSVACSLEHEDIFCYSDNRRIFLHRIQLKKPCRIFDHCNKVCQACFSASGNRILSCSEDGSVRIWDADSGDELTCLIGDGSFHCVASSSKDDFIASGSFKGIIKIWNMKSGKLISSCSGHRGCVANVEFLAWDEKLVSYSTEDGTLRLWDITSGKELKCLGDVENRVVCYAISSKRLKLAVGMDNGIVWLFDFRRGVTPIKLLFHRDRVWNISFDTLGQLLATGSVDGNVTIYPTEHSRRTLRLQGHRGAVLAVTFSDDSKWVASASEDETVRIWNVRNGKEITTIKGHGCAIDKLAFCKNAGNTLVGSCDETHLWKWNAFTGKCLEATSTVYDLVRLFKKGFNIPFRFLECNQDIAVKDAHCDKEVAWLPGPCDIVDIDPSGKVWITVRENGHINLFRLENYDYSRC